MLDPFDSLLASWELHLRAEAKSPKTLALYLKAARELADYARTQGLRDWEAVDRTLIRKYVGAMLERTSAGNASVNYRAVQQLFKWLLLEDEIEVNPMAGMTGPKVVAKPVPVIGLDDLARLMANVAGRDFTSRRDNAILRLLLDTGVRLAECAGLTLDDVDLVRREALVTGKGSRMRTVRFGHKTAKAIDRYLRSRASHPAADLPGLWLSPKRRTALTLNGIQQMVQRRGIEIGVHLHPHKFRHTFAHLWLDQGGAEGDLMELAGWSSRQMLERYGASARGARARRAYDRLSIGDQV